MPLTYLRALWSYRHFVLGQVLRDLKNQYAGSALAWLWVFLPPVAQIFIFTVVFAFVLQARLPYGGGPFQYSLHLLVSVLPWMFFLDTTNRCIAMFSDYSLFIRNLAFPRICLPAIALLNAGCSFAIQAVLAVVFILAIGKWPGGLAALAIPLLLLQTLFALGLGLALGVAHVYFRDVGKGFNIIAQFWFWLTPIVYPIEIVPATLRDYLLLNPMTGLVLAYQRIFVGGMAPDPHILIPPAALAALFVALGLLLFRRHAETIVDEL